MILRQKITLFGILFISCFKYPFQAHFSLIPLIVNFAQDRKASLGFSEAIWHTPFFVKNNDIQLRLLPKIKTLIARRITDDHASLC